MRRLLLLVLSFTIVVPPVDAAIYAYRDERGHLYLTDSPPSKDYRIVVTTRKDRAEMDNPDRESGGATTLRFESQKVLLPNDEAFSAIINEAARKEGIDPYLIKAVIKVESDFDPNVVSSKGARGLMQLIPGTAALVGCRDSFDPQQNIFGGARYLRMMLDRFNHDLELAAAAYNAGPGKVDQYRGIPPYRETQNYVRKVKYYLEAFRNEGGLTPTALTVVRRVPAKAKAPQSTDLTRRLASAYAFFQAGKTEEAIGAYQQVAMLYPRNTQALYNLACLLDQEHRYEESIKSYQQALLQDPYMDKALYNLAIIQEKLGHHQQAIACWRRFISVTKDEEKIIAAERYIRELQEYAALQP